MKYVSIRDCHQFVFPYIYNQLTSNEPTDQYEKNIKGLGELTKVLDLVQNNSFYPLLKDKAAYLLSSIAGSQYFNNGNKRLGVIVLIFFLIINDVEIRVLTIDQYLEIVGKFFPMHTWENNSNIQENEPLLLYNLAIIIGDKKRQGEGADFDILKQNVSRIFDILYRLSN